MPCGKEVFSARYDVSGWGGGFHCAGLSSRISFIGCIEIRSSTSHRHSKGFFLCRRHEAIELDRIASLARLWVITTSVL
jgi:hypothetical protein